MIEAFTEAGAAVAGVYDARDLTEDEHVRATQMLTEIDDDDLGPVLQHNVMWRLSRSPGRIRFTGRTARPGHRRRTQGARATTTTRSTGCTRKERPVNDPLD